MFYMISSVERRARTAVHRELDQTNAYQGSVQYQCSKDAGCNNFAGRRLPSQKVGVRQLFWEETWFHPSKVVAQRFSRRNSSFLPGSILPRRTLGFIRAKLLRNDFSRRNSSFIRAKLLRNVFSQRNSSFLPGSILPRRTLGFIRGQLLRNDFLGGTQVSSQEVYFLGGHLASSEQSC
jgi:hypothetical protein